MAGGVRPGAERPVPQSGDRSQKGELVILSKPCDHKGMRKVLPVEITSYDLFKTFALVTMVIDHVGYYFFPEDLWLRVIGRVSAPIWFFLIGYANSRDLGEKMWGGLILLVAANLVVGMPVFPLNILATMIFIRLVIDEAMLRAVRNHEALLGVSLIVVFLVIPFMGFWEYGTAGVLFAMYGCMRRHPEALARLPKDSATLFITFVVVFYVGFQSLVFGFDRVQALSVAVGLLPVIFWMSVFRPQVYPAFTRALAPVGAGLLKLCGRFSLEFYALHLIAFKLIALLAGYPHYQWFNIQSGFQFPGMM